VVNVVRTTKWSTNFEDQELWNKMKWMVTQSLQWQLDLEANWQVIETQTKDNLKNGKEYARFTGTPY